MINKKRICVITGTRAEYGILKPLLKKLKESEKLELILGVTGMHFLKEHGDSIKEIQDDGFDFTKIPMYTEESEEHSESIANGIKNMAKFLKKEKPDMLVVFGDRLEPLAAIISAATLDIPIAHISGGDKTDSGIIDESIRHSMTKFAHLHFPETKKSAKRIERMGEEKWRIHLTGALEIDAILQREKVNKEELFKKYDLNPNESLIICIQHSVNIDSHLSGEHIKDTISAIKEIRAQTLMIYPNNDPGSKQIITELNKINEPFIKVVKNVEHSDYLNLLSYASLIIGNSTSAITEAPTFGVPAINIGSRNTGREHSKNLVYVEQKKEKIVNAMKKALYNESYRKRVKKCKNVYGGGDSAEKIAQILENTPIDHRLLNKKLTY